MPLTGTSAAVPVAQTPATPPAAGDLRVAQMNLYNLFDTVNDPRPGDDDSTPTAAQYATKLEKIARAVTELGTPDIISVNEIENDTVMRDLLARPELAGAGYEFIVQERNNDERGIRTGIVYKGDRLELVGVDAPNPEMPFADGGRGQIDPALLYARPPLVADFKVRGAAQAGDGAAMLTVAVNHLKSKNGGDAPEQRRQMQGQYLGEWLDTRRASRPSDATIVVGDLNAVYGDGAYEKLASRADGSARLHDAPLAMDEGDRYTYLYKGEKRMLDHLMVDDGHKDAIKGVDILRLNTPRESKQSRDDASTAVGYSDHDPIVATFDMAKLLA